MRNKMQSILYLNFLLFLFGISFSPYNVIKSLKKLYNFFKINYIIWAKDDSIIIIIANCIKIFNSADN